MAPRLGPGSRRVAERGFVRQVTELVRIDRIAAGGDGVGRLPDGRVAFVPRTAPGDLAAIAVGRSEKRFVRARLVSLAEPGPDRVEPRCPHYQRDECGGCQLQHLSSAGQLAARRGILADAMTRIAKAPVELPPLEPAPTEWAYRSKISLSVGPSGVAGYHRFGRPRSLFPLERCLIASDGVNALWARVDAARRLLPRGATRLVLRLDRSGGEHLIVSTDEGSVWNGGKTLWAAARDERDATPLTVWWQPAAGAPRAMAGANTAYPATAFEQIHPAMGDRVRQYAVEQLGSVAGRRIWDLYAGIGETSTLVAGAGAAVVESVESDRGAVEEAERRQVELGRRIARSVGLAERVVDSLGAPDLVITNPPRTGMGRAVVTGIRARAPERVVYVSCDPATLARDLARLGDRAGPGAAYRVAGLRAFDLFPQTAHLETVAVLERL